MKNQLYLLALLLIIPFLGKAQSNTLTLSATTTIVSCYGGNNGSIDLTVSGGTPQYTYVWSNGATTEDLNNLVGGNYCVTVVDASGNTATLCPSVCQPPAISISGSVTNTLPMQCTGSIDLSISGGAPPYAVDWSTANGDIQVTGLCEGTYQAVVTDANGCTGTASFTVFTGTGGQNFNPVPIVTSATCADTCDGSLKISTLQGFSCTYTISNGVSGNYSGNFFILTGLCAGDQVNMQINGPGGYSSNISRTIGFSPSTNITIQSSNPALCNQNGQAGCERVCPGAVVDYFINVAPSSCGAQAQKTWTITGAASYTIAPDNKSVQVHWGESGAGQVALVLNYQCYSMVPAARCVEIIEKPEAKFQPNPVPAGDTLVVCKGQKVWFENQSLRSDHYEWLFADDASTSLDVNPDHTFKVPGVFAVQLISRSACFCADTTVRYVQVLDAETPLVDCVNTVCPGESITFTASASCGQYTWTVNGGNITAGGGPSDQSVTVQWANAADPYIQLSVSSCTPAACPSPAFFRIPVLNNHAQIRGPELVCPGAEEYYEIGPFDGVNLQWTVLSGGTLLEGQGRDRVRVRWNNNATQGKLQVAYDNCYLGCNGADTILVNIRRPFRIDGPAEACFNSSQFFKAVTTNGIAILSDWTLFDTANVAIWNSAAAADNVTISFNIPAGDYRLEAIPTGTGSTNTCSSKAAWNVYVAPLPAPPTGISGPGVFCPGQSQVYAATGLPPDARIGWAVNYYDIPGKTEGNPIVIAFYAGSPRWLEAYQISQDGLECQSPLVHMDVFQYAGLNISGPAGRCQHTEGNYQAQNLAGFSYTWSLTPVDAGIIVSGQGTAQIKVFWKKPGNHTINLNTCSLNSTFDVQVFAEPQPMVQAPVGVCPGSNALVSVTPAFNTYVWKNEAGGYLGNSSSYNAAPGVYAVQVSDAHGCTATSEFEIAEYPVPNVSVSTADPTGFCNNSRNVHMVALVEEDGDFTFEWFRDGQALNVNQPTYNTNQYGLYSVKVTNQYGCSDTDGDINVFEYCGGVCHNPNHPPVCPIGSMDFSIDHSVRCDSVQFTLLPGPDYVAGSAYWEFGKSGQLLVATSSQENPTVVFPNAGKYVVFLFADLQTGASCVYVDSFDVEAKAQWAALDNACPNENTHFQDESTFLPDAGITAWNWAFGDSQTGTGRFPAHAYSQSGDYTVKLTVTAPSGCTSSYTNNVHVADVPQPEYILPALSCEGNALPFSWAPGSDVSQLSWLFYNSSSALIDSISGENAYHIFNTDGSYFIQINVKNISGCKNSFTDTLNVMNNPLNGQILPGYISICEGQTIGLNAPPGGATYHWSEGSNTPSITVGTEGIYKVTLTDANGCTYVPNAKNVYVEPAPHGVIKAQVYDENGLFSGITYPSLEVCDGEIINLIVQSVDVSFYHWSNNSYQSEIYLAEDRNNLPGPGDYLYVVTITNSNGCSAVLDPFPVYVHPTPEGISAVSTQPCAGSPAEISVQGSLEPDWQYFWNNGEIGPSFTTSEAGHYFARVVNAFNCSANSSPVTLNPGPNIAAVPGGCHSRCRPDTLCMPDLPDIVQWQWFLDGAPLPGATGPDFVALESGTYWAEMTDTAGCHAQSEPLVLDLYDGLGNILADVWADVNHNGLIDASDTLVTGVVVNLVQNAQNLGAYPSGNLLIANLPATDPYLLSIDTSLLAAQWSVVIGQDTAALFGCDQTAALALLIDNSCAAPGVLDFYVCPGEQVVYNNTPIPTGSSQTLHLTGYTGCDSLLTINAFELFNSQFTLQVNACAGQFFDYNGTPISSGQSSIFILNNAVGCDSILTVQVLPLTSSAGALNTSACAGESYDYNGTLIPAGQSQQFTLTNYLGCDSILTVNVSSLPVSAGALNTSACAGESYDYNGTLIPAGQSQQFTLTNYLGCDSVLTVNVSVLPATAGVLNASVCPGENYDYNGTLIPAGQSQQFTLSNYLGCDSLLTVNVATLPVSNTTEVYTVCPDAGYDYQGTLMAPGSEQTFHFSTYEGCDSAVTVRIEAYPPFVFQVVSEKSCVQTPTGSIAIQAIGAGEPWLYALNTQAFQSDSLFIPLAAGTYTLTVEDVNACTQSTEVEVPEYGAFVVELPDAVLPCDALQVPLKPLISGDTDGLSLLWWNGSTGLEALAQQPGIVWVEAANICATVRSEAQVVLANIAGDTNLVYLPNIIAPAADKSENASFQVYFVPDVTVLNFQLDVFDRWGDQVFSSNNPGKGWDADFRTRAHGPAVFVYVLETDVLFCGREFHIRKKGDFTVVR